MFSCITVTSSYIKLAGFKSYSVVTLGCARKNPHLPNGWDSGNSRGRGGGGGGKRLWKSRREGGLNLRKSSAGLNLTDSSCDSNV